GRIRRMIGAYEATYAAWRQDPEGFWAQAAESIHWYRRWDQVLDASRAPFYRWFSGGLVNTCYNLLDVHVENGRAEQVALIYEPMVPEPVIAMLACARIGAIHSVVFGGFAADELASRINDARPKVIVS